MLRVRLRRMGARNAPFYRIVVSDSRNTPLSSCIEEVGYYDPRRNPKVFEVDRERVDHWVGRGARVSDTLGQLMAKYPAGGSTESSSEPSSPQASVPEAVTSEAEA